MRIARGLEIPKNKICTKCGILKSLDSFSPCKEMRDGHTSWCKSCKAEAERERRSHHTDADRVQYNTWRRGRRNLDREGTNAKNSAWQAAHPEQRQNWLDKNRERVRELGCYSDHARRARLAEVPTEKWSRSEIIERDGLVCYLCGASVDKTDIDIDHKIPISRGGSNLKINLGVTHSSCNRKKWNLTPEEYWQKIGS